MSKCWNHPGVPYGAPLVTEKENRQIEWPCSDWQLKSDVVLRCVVDPQPASPTQPHQPFTSATVQPFTCWLGDDAAGPHQQSILLTLINSRLQHPARPAARGQ